MNPLFDLSGQVALVTGASRGLGLGMARGLAEAGARVVLTGRDAATLDAAAEGLRADGLDAVTACFDATDIDAVQAAIGGLARLDILVANAGIHGARPLAEWREADWQRVMQADLTSAFFAAQQAAAIMQRQRHGRIIFTGSLTGSRGRPTIHGYAAAKAGLAAITRTLAAELGEHGITVNTIAGGYFETEMSAAMRRDPEVVARISARIPLRRWGTPRDMAGIAVFLAGAAGGYVTGQEIFADGGLGSVI